MSARPCGLCGRETHGNGAEDGVWLCHDGPGLTCYERWTVYGVRPTAPMSASEATVTAEANVVLAGLIVAAQLRQFMLLVATGDLSVDDALLKLGWPP